MYTLYVYKTCQKRTNLFWEKYTRWSVLIALVLSFLFPLLAIILMREGTASLLLMSLLLIVENLIRPAAAWAGGARNAD